MKSQHGLQRVGLRGGPDISVVRSFLASVWRTGRLSDGIRQVAPRHAVPVVGAVAIVVGLAGCGSSDGFAILDGQVEAVDELPPTVGDEVSDEVRDESVRFVTDFQGDALYLARGRSAGIVCLIVVPETDQAAWRVGCGELQDGTTQTPAAPLRIRTDSTRLPSGDTEISRNLSVVGG